MACKVRKCANGRNDAFPMFSAKGGERLAVSGWRKRLRVAASANRSPLHR